MAFYFLSFAQYLFKYPFSVLQFYYDTDSLFQHYLKSARDAVRIYQDHVLEY